MEAMIKIQKANTKYIENILTIKMERYPDEPSDDSRQCNGYFLYFLIT